MSGAGNQHAHLFSCRTTGDARGYVVMEAAELDSQEISKAERRDVLACLLSQQLVSFEWLLAIRTAAVEARV